MKLKARLSKYFCPAPSKRKSKRKKTKKMKKKLEVIKEEEPVEVHSDSGMDSDQKIAYQACKKLGIRKMTFKYATDENLERVIEREYNRAAAKKAAKIALEQDRQRVRDQIASL